MKKLFTVLLSALALSVVGQVDSETYTALKVSAEDAPTIDGNLDPVYQALENGNHIVPLLKVPEQGGEIHELITVPDPTVEDFSAEFGMLWDENGMYFLFRITDDVVVIEDECCTDQPADQWWTDDNVNILFSKDLVNNSFTQWEFAYQYNIDQEEKLSSDLWLNAALIDESLVETAWHQDGNTYTLETFIDWGAFDDGNATITEGMKIYLEMRARDDDDTDSWESMFHWSTTNYDVESSGEGLGEVTLSSDVIVVEDVVLTGLDLETGINVYPNPTSAEVTASFGLLDAGHVKGYVYDLSGNQVQTVIDNFMTKGKHQVNFDVSTLRKGLYFLRIESQGQARSIKFNKY